LSEEQFRPIEKVMADQAKTWGGTLNKPIDIKFAPAIESIPPAPPSSENPLKVIF
jgi:hypothetical protein